jgi:2-oxoglutarate dehydrogenase E2 component (dihydrolipoamide succinyltransferase)
VATDVEVPALGESITEGTLANWLKKPGEAVAADEPIAELETDKVSVEVPSPVAGVLAEQLVQAGDTVAVGAVIARIDDKAPAAAPPQPSPSQAAAASATNPAGAGETPLLRGDEHAPEPAMADAETSSADDHITTLSPAVRRAVLECRPDQDPRQRQGRAADERRRDCRR